MMDALAANNPGSSAYEMPREYVVQYGEGRKMVGWALQYFQSWIIFIKRICSRSITAFLLNRKS